MVYIKFRLSVYDIDRQHHVVKGKPKKQTKKKTKKQKRKEKDTICGIAVNCVQTKNIPFF